MFLVDIRMEMTPAFIGGWRKIFISGGGYFHEDDVYWGRP